MKKSTGVVIMGRRFKGQARRTLDFATSSGEEDNQTQEVNNDMASKGEEEHDYSEEQYPPTDDKYKQLEDRLNAMEIQRVPGLDFE